MATTEQATESRLAQLDLQELVGEMTSAMLGCGVTTAPDGATAAGPEVVGIVHLSADEWSGSVLVGMPAPVAATATATMFMLDVDDVDDELIADAMGEFANVLAGQVKGAIGGGCSLSLPSVTTGTGLQVTVPGTTLVIRHNFHCDLGPLSVATMESKRRSHS